MRKIPTCRGRRTRKPADEREAERLGAKEIRPLGKETGCGTSVIKMMRRCEMMVERRVANEDLETLRVAGEG